MAVTFKELIPSKAAENAQTTQYTATNCRTVIDKFTATNVSGSNATLSVNLIASGGTAGTANRVLSLVQIAPGECYTCPELVNQILDNGSFISTLAGTAAAITIRCSGHEITS